MEHEQAVTISPQLIEQASSEHTGGRDDGPSLVAVGQFDLLHAERQLTLDGRAEPLQTALVELKAETQPPDDLTLPLPFKGVGQQLRLPRYMQACEHDRWHLSLRHKATGEEKRVVWKCRSWRHQGECARFVASRDFARISEALSGAQAEDITYLVLTFDQARDAAERGLTPLQGYRLLVRRWQSLRQWLARTYGPLSYVATVEQHRTGWPHFNVVVVCSELASAIRAEGRKGDNAPSWLKAAAVRAGFGWKVWAETARDVQQLAGYIVKLAHKETLTGEVSKLSQLPLASPRGTRRLRSSCRFLPPSTTSTGEWTGDLLKHSVAQAQQLDAMREADELAKRQALEAYRREVVAQLLGARADLPPTDAAASGAGAEPQVELPVAQPRLVTTGTSYSPDAVGVLAAPVGDSPEAVWSRRFRPKDSNSLPAA